MSPTADKMLIGQIGPWTQTRIDLNALYGTDTSGGTNPFTNPTNVNDGNDTTHADRAADASELATFIQTGSMNGTGRGPFTATLMANPVTAGNLLIGVAHKFNPHDNPSFFGDPPTIFHGSSGRPFTLFSGSPFEQSGTYPSGFFDTWLCYRVATGDEQTLTFQNTGDDIYFAMIEISNAASAAGFEVLTSAPNSASTSKVIGTFTTPGDLQVMALTYGQAAGGDRPLDQSAGTGYTMDVQDGKPTGGGLYILNYALAHGSSGAAPTFTGGSTIWGGSAVGVTSSTGSAEDSWLQADLGQTRRANRMELLESSNTGNTYLLQYSPNGSSWTTITASRTYLGGNRQRYDFDEIGARYWRIKDDHPSGGALSSLTWDTWTIEGFPF